MKKLFILLSFTASLFTMQPEDANDYNAFMVTKEELELLKQHSSVINNMAQNLPDEDAFPVPNLKDSSLEALCSLLPALGSKRECTQKLKHNTPVQLLDLLHTSNYLDLNVFGNKDEEKEVVNFILDEIAEQIEETPSLWLLNTTHYNSLSPTHHFQPEWNEYLNNKISESMQDLFFENMYNILEKHQWRYYYNRHSRTYTIDDRVIDLPSFNAYIGRLCLQQKLLLMTINQFYEAKKSKQLKSKRGLRLEKNYLVGLFRPLHPVLQTILKRHFKVKVDKKKLKPYKKTN